MCSAAGRFSVAAGRSRSSARSRCLWLFHRRKPSPHFLFHVEHRGAKRRCGLPRSFDDQRDFAAWRLGNKLDRQFIERAATVFFEQLGQLACDNRPSRSAERLRQVVHRLNNPLRRFVKSASRVRDGSEPKSCSFCPAAREESRQTESDRLADRMQSVRAQPRGPGMTSTGMRFHAPQRRAAAPDH